MLARATPLLFAIGPTVFRLRPGAYTDENLAGIHECARLAVAEEVVGGGGGRELSTAGIAAVDIDVDAGPNADAISLSPKGTMLPRLRFRVPPSLTVMPRASAVFGGISVSAAPQ